MTEGSGARADWQARIGRRSNPSAERRVGAVLPAPAGLHARPGRAQVTLVWQPVAGALGYLVSRSDRPDGHFVPVDHGGGDVLAVPGPPYTDTTGEPGRLYRYAVAAVADVEGVPGRRSQAVTAASSSAGPAAVAVVVDAASTPGRLRRLWQMVGTERLSQLLDASRSGGVAVADDFAEALRIGRDELGVRRVRAHAILHDDLGVAVGDHGFDFGVVDSVYDRLLALGLRPVVELSFTPARMASDASRTVFDYDGIVSPPSDLRHWAELVQAVVGHLVDRYGLDEVAGWGFEVWNEPNLAVFWTGSQADYFALYAATARAVKAVDERLLVGGPATAAAGWLGDFCDWCVAQRVPLDFVSTHLYGNVPLDVRALLAARGLDEVAVWWTEWGVTPTHFNPVCDAAFGAPFLLHGVKRAQTSADALAYWVLSDHFEELGRPPALLHGGFGLLTVGNLRKPRFWALALAEQLDDRLCAVRLTGDGAGGMVDAWASRGRDGRVDVLAWNGTLDQSKAAGEPLLDRSLAVRVQGLGAERYSLTLARVDNERSSLAARWTGARAWPTAAEWARLRADDRLDVEGRGPVRPERGTVQVSLDLPMPGVARLRLDPC